jgi:hypothetical protein
MDARLAAIIQVVGIFEIPMPFSSFFPSPYTMCHVSGQAISKSLIRSCVLVFFGRITIDLA